MAYTLTHNKAFAFLVHFFFFLLLFSCIVVWKVVLKLWELEGNLRLFQLAEKTFLG